MAALGVDDPRRPAASINWSAIRVLACDFDGTLAYEGRVAEATTAALGRLKASGRRLVLVTGRELRHLTQLYRYLPLFDAVVAENGATLYQPPLARERLLTQGPSSALLAALQDHRVEPLALGRVIVSTPVENEDRLHAAIAAAGAGWRTIRNKRSLMALPAGVDKASGLLVALDALGLAAREALGVGDAENDETFLAVCGVSAAPPNALPALKAKVDITTRREDGAGVAELIDELLRGNGRTAGAPPNGPRDPAGRYPPRSGR